VLKARALASHSDIISINHSIKSLWAHFSGKLGLSLGHRLDKWKYGMETCRRRQKQDNEENHAVSQWGGKKNITRMKMRVVVNHDHGDNGDGHGGDDSLKSLHW